MNMRTQFLNAPDDCQWLRETHLRGVCLPTKYKDFTSFTIEGNEDAPSAVNLYVAEEPRFDDDFERVLFVDEGAVYAEACEYDGQTGKPYGGLSPITR